MPNTGDRTECPACLSVTYEVAAAMDAKRPCPHCHLPWEVIGPVQDARNGKLPAHVVDALIAYARESVVRAATIDRLQDEIAVHEARTNEATYRADTTLAQLRHEQKLAADYRATTGADLERARWRISHVREQVARAFDAPYPEALR
jgi:hypothetical protein